MAKLITKKGSARPVRPRPRMSRYYVRADHDRSLVSIFDDEWLAVRVRALITEIDPLGDIDLMPKKDRIERDAEIDALEDPDEDEWDWAQRRGRITRRRDDKRLKRMPLSVQLAVRH